LKKLLLFCAAILSCYASSASEATNQQNEIAKGSDSIFQTQFKEFNNIKRLLTYIDLTQAERIFELDKSMRLTFIRFQIESEGIIEEMR